MTGLGRAAAIALALAAIGPLSACSDPVAKADEALDAEFSRLPDTPGSGGASADAYPGGVYCPLSARQAKLSKPSAKSTKTISRADATARADRRFRNYDKNEDGRLVQSEIPANKARKAMRRFDRNRDGTIDKAEWSTRMLAEFNKRDENQDGILKPDERGARYTAAPIETTNDDGDES